MVSLFIPFFIAATLGIGFWASKKVKTSEDFTLAGKSLSTAFVGVTLFATWFGSNQVVGNPAEFIQNGFSTYVALTFGEGLCLFLVAIFFAKQLYKHNYRTIGDFIRERFNQKLEFAFSLITILSYPHWIAAQLVALGFLFQSVLNISLVSGILLGALSVVVYTYVGGMWAVSYTDMVQSVLIVVGLIFLLFPLLDQVGGIESALASQDESFYSLFPPPGLENLSDFLATFLAIAVGALPGQEIYQRVFSAKSEKAAVRGLILSSGLIILVSTIPYLIAIAAIKVHPELAFLEDGQSLIPELVNKFTPVPLQILFYGALISAIMSTSSGAMLAPATVIGENLVKPYFKGLSDKNLLLFTRLSILLVAIISCAIAITQSNIIDLLVASLSLMFSSLVVPFIFGVHWKRANSTGAWASILAGGGTWFICYLLETTIDSTLYGICASLLGMLLGSFFGKKALVPVQRKD
ncbi:sodium:solute symporter family protein [Algoriphagus sediminis]|uniref:Sodium:solute symporter family protein n=1 Tax=Algoriphagus sediminis TaxID=3057113 RepID=A0ABT7YF65_9BACT|nr:sodium:solute symporter family protein [Algoriphagus sediminis]MDN3205164.1 sodium:solute symporter family protein [Algoriphagus sediminis]